MNIQKKYNQTAVKYSKRENRYYWTNIYLKPISEYIKYNKPDFVIDIGCGSGILSKHLAEQFPHINFLGIDFSEKLIDIANKDLSFSNISFIAADFIKQSEDILCSINFENKNIVLLAIGSMAYYDEQDDFSISVKTVFQKVKQGGLIATFHNNNLIFRKYLKGIGKKYWTLERILKFFSPYRQYYNQYISIIFLGKQTHTFEFGDRVLLYMDRLSSKLPKWLCEKLHTSYFVFLTK